MKKNIYLIFSLFIFSTFLFGCNFNSKFSNSTKEIDDYVANENDGNKQKKPNAINKEDIKIGILYLGNQNNSCGYTYSHEIGINAMQSNLELKDEQIIRKNSVDASNPQKVQQAIDECVESGCNIIFGTSDGYSKQMEIAAKKYPKTYFSQANGHINNGVNLNCYSGKMYEARYLSGIVAGLNTKSNKIGFVAAYGKDNSEVTSGIDAFALGVNKVNSEAKIYVKVINSFNDSEKEKKSSQELILEGCDILAQHCDSEIPQNSAQENKIYSIGYNSDMSKQAPDAALASVVWNWNAYYTMAVQNLIDGTYDNSDYYGGLSENMVNITGLSDFNEKSVKDKVNETTNEILDGSFVVFNGILETNDGSSIGSIGSNLDDNTIKNKINWYYKNVIEE